MTTSSPGIWATLQPGDTRTLSFAVIPQPGAGGMTQTLPTRSTAEISGTLS